MRGSVGLYLWRDAGQMSENVKIEKVCPKCGGAVAISRKGAEGSFVHVSKLNIKWCSCGGGLVE